MYIIYVLEDTQHISQMHDYDLCILSNQIFLISGM